VAIPAGKAAVLPVMEPGDVMVFNGSTIHGSGPNVSRDRFRRSLICHYVPASTAQMSQWYKDPISFDGRVKVIGHNTDGGPCGTPHPSDAVAASSPH